MSGRDCERCGTSVAPGRVICPMCDNVVGDIFGVDETVNIRAWASIPSGLDDALEPPTVRLRPASLPTLATSPPQRGVELPSFEEMPATDTDGHDPFSPAFTAKIHAGILRSTSDAIVLGDVGDVAELMLIEQPQADIDDDFLTSTTDAETRVVIPVQVAIGRDVVKQLAPEVVLRIDPEVDPNWLPLSAVERLVLTEIDGIRPVGRLQARFEERMVMPAAELRLMLALLIDKGVLQAVGVARAADRRASTLKTQVRQTRSDASGITAVLASPLPQPPPPSPSLSPLSPLAVLDVVEGPDAGDNITAPLTAPVRSPRSLLASMLDEAPSPSPSARPPPRMAPVPKTAPPTPLLTPSRATERSAGGVIVADGGRSRAARLHAQCLQDIRNGEIARAWQLACMAQAAAPDEPRYQMTLDTWATVLEAHQTPLVAKRYAAAIRKESVGDIDGAARLLQELVNDSPEHAGAWNRLGLLRASRMSDLKGGVAALKRAVALAPDDATYRNNLGKVAAAAERSGLGRLLGAFSRKGP